MVDRPIILETPLCGGRQSAGAATTRDGAPRVARARVDGVEAGFPRAGKVLEAVAIATVRACLDASNGLRASDSVRRPPQDDV